MSDPTPLSKEDMIHGDVYAGFVADGRLLQIGETGADEIYLELDEAQALRDWLNKVLP